jgi:hypothetical protein
MYYLFIGYWVLTNFPKNMISCHHKPVLDSGSPSNCELFNSEERIITITREATNLTVIDRWIMLVAICRIMLIII